MMADLEQELEEAWDDIMERYYYPSLKQAEIVDQIELFDTARFDFKNSQTCISRSFVEELVTKTGLSEQKALRGILGHEIGHYMNFPRKLSTSLLLGYFAEKVFEEKGLLVYAQYIDVVNNLELILNQKFPEVLDTCAALEELNQQSSSPSLLNNLCTAFYLYQADLPFTLDPFLQRSLEEMKKIDFRADQPLSQHYSNMHLLGRLIEEYLPKQKVVMMLTRGACKIKGKYLSEILKGIDSEELRGAMREIMKGTGKGEAEKIKDWVEEKIEKGIFEGPLSEEEKESEQGEGEGIRLGGGRFRVKQRTIDYYKELSRAYPLVILKKPVKTDTDDPFPKQVTEWSAGDPLQDVNPYSSGGKLFPGITKKWLPGYVKRQEIEFKIPHLLILIDSSGSMPNPERGKSYAVLSGFCAANSYHANEGHVAVINFSGESLALDFNRDLRSIYAMLAGYQGGGTEIDVDFVRDIIERNFTEEDDINELINLSQKELKDLVHAGELPYSVMSKEAKIAEPNLSFSAAERGIDILLITDGGIANIDESLQYLAEQGKVNRTTIIHVHRFPFGGDSILLGDDDIPLKKNIAYYLIEEDKDILDITIGETQRNLTAALSYGP